MAKSKVQQIQLIAFLAEDDGKILEKVLKEEGVKAYEIKSGGVKEAIEYFSNHRSSKYLVIDISNCDMPVSDLNKLADVCEPDISVIAVGSRNEVGLYRDLMKLGILEYIVKPLYPDILGHTIQSMIGEEKGKKDKLKLGKIISVAGSRGGVGSTFLSVSLAAILAIERSRRVVVVDMDFQYGTVSLYTNVKTNFGLKNALEDPDRLDPLILERLLSSVNERYSILSTEDPLDDPTDFKVEGIKQLLGFLSQHFHYVIVDLPHCSNIFTKVVLDQANLLLLVTDLSLAGLRDTGRLMRLWGKQGVDRRLLVVLNKFIRDEKDSLTIAHFEESLKNKVDHVIPYDSNVPKKFINEGRMITGDNGSFAKSIRSIVDDIQGNITDEKNERFVDKLLKWLKFKEY